MTQKDSEDDDTRPGETPAPPETGTVEDVSRESPPQPDAIDPPSFEPSTAGARDIPQPEPPLPPRPDEPETEDGNQVAPHLPDESGFDLPPQTTDAAPADVAAVIDAEPDGSTILAPSYDASRAPPVTLADLESALTDDGPVDAVEDLPPPAVEPEEPLTADATEQAPRPSVEEMPAEALQPVRPVWETPPPIIDTPSWQWRDIGPEISPPTEPLPPEPELLHAAGDVPPPVAAEVAEPPPPVAPPEPPKPPPPVEPSVPPQLPPQDTARQEPAWHAAPVHAVFQDAPVRFDTQPVNEPSRWDRAKDLARTGARYAAYAVGGYFAIVFVLILLYRFVNPPASSLMIVQSLTGTSVNQEWVPLDEISPALVRAVIVSEDWSFCEHYGIDIAAIEQAIERSGNGIPRGASTISMQTTKNLFLWNAKSYVRKAVELPLTLAIETVWPKHRILEIYLNVAEWGPGIFGAEAAAQYHFNKPASRLSEREAAQLAASLPNPIIREAGDPGPRTARKATVIQYRMRNAGGAAQCVLGNGR